MQASDAVLQHAIAESTQHAAGSKPTYEEAEVDNAVSMSKETADPVLQILNHQMLDIDNEEQLLRKAIQ